MQNFNTNNIHVTLKIARLWMPTTKMSSIQTITNWGKTNFEAAKIIGLISDTHVPKRAMCIPQKVFEVLKDVISLFMQAT